MKKLHPVIIPVIFVCIFETLAQTSVKWAHDKKNVLLVSISVLCYAAVSAFLYKAYAYKGIGMVNVMWSGMSILLMLSIGYFIFGERISYSEWIGVLLISLGIVIIHTGYLRDF